MKSKIYTLILLITIVVGFTSCEDFIEVDSPDSQLPSESVFQSEETAKSALSDIYSQLRENGLLSGSNFGGTPIFANYSDDLEFYGSNLEIQQFNNHIVLSSNSLLHDFWTNSYSQIYATNAVIEGLDNSVNISTETKSQLLGEAVFLRSLVHFYLANLFGSVPYITSTDYTVNSTIDKISVVEMYEHILEDISYCEMLLSSEYPSMERVRINKGVATAFKARLHLYNSSWTEAENCATATINNPYYVWENNVSDVFLKNSPSIIWAFHPGIAGSNTNDARTFTVSDGPPSKPMLSSDLYNAFETGDLRKALWIKIVTDGNTTYHQTFKYKNDSSTSISEEYTILFRLAEQYLIRSEARAQLGNISGSQDDLNMIRNRAGLPNTTANTTEQLLAAILKERRFELFTEQSHRWLDLKRSGNAANVLTSLKPGWRDTDVLLPIPAAELILNSNLLPQNPGY